MKIYCDKNPKGQSIAISGSADALLSLGRALSEGKDIQFKAEEIPSRFYPILLRGFSFNLLSTTEALLEVVVEAQQLHISGGAKTAEKLGQSLLNFFSGEVMPGEHFHLDFFEGNGILAPTRYHLIFQAEEPDRV